MRHLIAALLLLCAVATDGTAQLAGLEPGARVRVSVPVRSIASVVPGADRWQTGVVIESDTAAVSLRLESGVVTTIPYDVMSQAQVSRGTQSSTAGARKGLLRGLGVGFGSSVVFYGLTQLFNVEYDCEANCTGEEGVPSFFGPEYRPYIVYPTVAGAVLGLGFGSQARERWQPLTLPNRLLSVRPVPGGGAAVGLSLRF